MFRRLILIYIYVAIAASVAAAPADLDDDVQLSASGQRHTQNHDVRPFTVRNPIDCDIIQPMASKAMHASNRKHQHPGINGVRLGVSAGPLSLLLLPKCPLCLVPLLAVLGLAVPPIAGLWIASGLMVAVWLTIVLAATRRQPVIRTVALVAGAASFVAIGFQFRLLLWVGVLAMTATGFVLSRICADRAICSQTLTSASPEA